MLQPIKFWPLTSLMEKLIKRRAFGCHAFVKTHKRNAVLTADDLAFRTFDAASARLRAVQRREGDGVLVAGDDGS
jgi:hypothetical protein